MIKDIITYSGRKEQNKKAFALGVRIERRRMGSALLRDNPTRAPSRGDAEGGFTHSLSVAQTIIDQDQKIAARFDHLPRRLDSIQRMNNRSSMQPICACVAVMRICVRSKSEFTSMTTPPAIWKFRRKI